MPWYVYALLASLLFAIVPLQKRRFNHSPGDVMFWSSLFAFLLTLIMFPLLEFPKNDWFYLGAVFTGLSGVFGGVLQFKLSEKNMGRTLSIQLPVQVLTCFVFYCLLQPSYYDSLFTNPVWLYVMIASLLVMFVSMQFLRKSDNNFLGLITVIPVSVLFAVIVVYYKIIMGIIPGELSNIILAYIMIHYFTVSVCFLAENIINKNRIINITESLTSNSLMIAVLNVFGYYFLFSAVYYAANPAFAIAFNILIPVWIKIYSIILNIKDDANLKIAIIILLAMSILVIASSI